MSEADGRRHANEMTSGNGNITDPHFNSRAGCQKAFSFSLQSLGKCFFLDIPFYRTRLPDRSSTSRNFSGFLTNPALTAPLGRTNGIWSVQTNRRSRIDGQQMSPASIPEELLAHRFSQISHYTSWGYKRQVGTIWDNQIANFSAVALRFFVEKCV